MYAIISLNGKQLRVSPEAILEVARLRGEPGQTLELDRVILVADGAKVSVGQPYLPNARVSAEIVAHFRGEKVRVSKFKKTKDYRRRRGYRSELTRIKVSAIQA
jgi:large subunit ribosomal protein L21